MEPEFWQERWKENRIAFHEGEINSLLAKHFHRLQSQRGDRVFVPLCGKAVDVPWLADQGCRVAGIELNQGAVEEVFSRMGVTPEISESDNLKAYQSGDIKIFVGDFFNLSKEMLGPVDAVYDRAALVALPAEMRKSYASHLAAITKNARQLLISFEYDQSAMDGPPFSVTGAEIKKLYAGLYTPQLVDSVDIGGLLRERSGGGTENAWLLDAV